MGRSHEGVDDAVPVLMPGRPEATEAGPEPPAGVDTFTFMLIPDRDT